MVFKTISLLDTVLKGHVKAFVHVVGSAKFTNLSEARDVDLMVSPATTLPHGRRCSENVSESHCFCIHLGSENDNLLIILAFLGTVVIPLLISFKEG